MIIGLITAELSSSDENDWSHSKGGEKGMTPSLKPGVLPLGVTVNVVDLDNAQLEILKRYIDTRWPRVIFQGYPDSGLLNIKIGSIYSVKAVHETTVVAYRHAIRRRAS